MGCVVLSALWVSFASSLISQWRLLFPLEAGYLPPLIPQVTSYRAAPTFTRPPPIRLVTPSYHASVHAPNMRSVIVSILDDARLPTKRLRSTICTANERPFQVRFWSITAPHNCCCLIESSGACKCVGTLCSSQYSCCVCAVFLAVLMLCMCRVSCCVFCTYFCCMWWMCCDFPLS